MKHKIFVSYSHRLDQNSADEFRKFFSDDSSVTVVLIGQETGGRSWID